MIGWMAWRLHRRGLIGFSVGGFLISLFYGSAFLQAAGSTAASQAAFGRSVSLVAKQFAFIVCLGVLVHAQRGGQGDLPPAPKDVKPGSITYDDIPYPYPV